MMMYGRREHGMVSANYEVTKQEQFNLVRRARAVLDGHGYLPRYQVIHCAILLISWLGPTIFMLFQRHTSLGSGRPTSLRYL